MYPEPHFPADEDRRVQDEIRRQGLAPDPLLERLERPVLGLNVALHWPLPAAFREKYEKLCARLSALDAGAYVYPYAETHVTVATLVSFKRHENPDAAEQARIRGYLPYLIETVGRITADIPTFSIDIGAPVLVRAAAFLPILNPGGEIARLREALDPALRAAGPELSLARIPRAVHMTILRFRTIPRDPVAFVQGFRSVAGETSFGSASVEDLLITSETRPYMTQGGIEHRFRLIPGLPIQTTPTQAR
jgi:hypothetical protein